MSKREVLERLKHQVYRMENFAPSGIYFLNPEDHARVLSFEKGLMYQHGQEVDGKSSIRRWDLTRWISKNKEVRPDDEKPKRLFAVDDVKILVSSAENMMLRCRDRYIQIHLELSCRC